MKRLMAELGYEVELTELRNNVKEIQKKGGEIFVHEINGNVVGSVCVLIDVRLAEGIFAEIVSLIVSEEERGKGIGSSLVRVAEEWARQRVGKVRVRANVVREAAYGFYTSQGYRRIKSQNVFIKTV